MRFLCQPYYFLIDDFKRSITYMYVYQRISLQNRIALGIKHSQEHVLVNVYRMIQGVVSSGVSVMFLSLFLKMYIVDIVWVRITDED